MHLLTSEAYFKLQIDEGIWNGFDFYYIDLDRINRIIRNFFACGEGPFGRRPLYPKDPVDPVQLFSLRSESIPLFLSKIRVSYLVRLAVFSGQRPRSYETSRNSEANRSLRQAQAELNFE